MLTKSHCTSSKTEKFLIARKLTFQDRGIRALEGQLYLKRNLLIICRKFKFRQTENCGNI